MKSQLSDCPENSLLRPFIVIESTVMGFRYSAILFLFCIATYAELKLLVWFSPNRLGSSNYWRKRTPS